MPSTPTYTFITTYFEVFSPPSFTHKLDLKPQSQGPQRQETSLIRPPQHISIYERITPTTYAMSCCARPTIHHTTIQTVTINQINLNGLPCHAMCPSCGGMIVDAPRMPAPLMPAPRMPRGVITEEDYSVITDADYKKMIAQADYDSDFSDGTVVGRMSNMRLGGRPDSQSTARGPRLLELPDSRSGTSSRSSRSQQSTSSRTDSQSTVRGPRLLELPDSRSGTSSRSSRSQQSTSSRTTSSHRSSTRESSRHSESHHSSSRPTDSHRRSTQASSRPSESRYSQEPSSRSSHRPSESRYSQEPSSRSSHRPSDSRYSQEPSSRSSHRPAESHYAKPRPTDARDRHSTMTSTRPSESRTYGAGKEVAVYAAPSSNDKGSTEKTKSKRSDSKSLKAVKHLVKFM